MDTTKEHGYGEKQVQDGSPTFDPEMDRGLEPVATENSLHRELKGRHMQMIAM